MAEPALGDVVSPHIDEMSGFAELQPQPPAIGVVTAISGVGPFTTSVLWSDGRQVTIDHAANESQLDKISAPVSNTDRDRVRFREIRRDSDTDNPSSQEFNGICVSVRTRTPYTATPTAVLCVLAKTGEAYIEDLASSFVVVEGR